MRIYNHIFALRKALARERFPKKTIGFVPTMGALHEGHLTLLRKCKKENDLSILSIFVNPAQFAPNEDFRRYPRNKKKDVLLANKEKVDIMFSPSVDEMYSRRYLTYVKVNRLSEFLCGKSRPGHFAGVATIVAKLLNIVEPDVLYLGQKDAQQCRVLEQMIQDLNFPVKVKIIPTVRETDGLAMSSRNQSLSLRERKEAAALYSILQEAKKKILQGEHQGQNITHFMQKMIFQKTSATIDYAACVDAFSLEPLKVIQGKVLLALAVRFRKTRLIDNILVHVS